MSRGLGFVQANIKDMLLEDASRVLAVADVMAEAGPGFDPRNIRRAFRSLVRRGEAIFAIKRGRLAIRLGRPCRIHKAPAEPEKHVNARSFAPKQKALQRAAQITPALRPEPQPRPRQSQVVPKPTPPVIKLQAASVSRPQVRAAPSYPLNPADAVAAKLAAEIERQKQQELEAFRARLTTK